ncbi:MAG: hypothetical protein ABIF88_03680 [archaeon]
MNDDVLWIVSPLIIATIAMLIYFEKYKDEKPGWNTLFSNSLILLFVSMILFRYIYNIESVGIINFTDHLSKFIVSLIILLIGIIILFLNFKHFLPEKIAKHLSSPLTLNLIAYIGILYVFSELSYSGWSIFISLLIIFLVLLLILNLVKIPLKNLFLYLKKTKEKEKKETIVYERTDIKKRKGEIKKIEKKTSKRKKEVHRIEKEGKRKNINELDKQKKEAVKLKKIVKK